MITMYEMIMTSALDANACLTPRGVTTGLRNTTPTLRKDEREEARN
jgi:hypothetical protein